MSGMNDWIRAAAGRMPAEPGAEDGPPKLTPRGTAPRQASGGGGGGSAGAGAGAAHSPVINPTQRMNEWLRSRRHSFRQGADDSAVRSLDTVKSNLKGKEQNEQ